MGRFGGCDVLEWLTSELKNDLRKSSLWKAVAGEFLATTLLVFIIVATVGKASSNIEISFAAGFGLAVLIHIFAPVSGAHLNPAVTAAAIITGDIRIIKAFLYAVAQFLGGIAGAVVAYALNSSSNRNELGCVKLAPSCNTVQGLFMEMILTSILEFTILSTVNLEKRGIRYPNSIPIGLALAVAHFIGIPYTGASLNPARAFGPAVVTNTWPAYHWIYWIGPYIGAIFTALLYEYILKTDLKKPQENESNTVAINMDGHQNCQNMVQRHNTVIENSKRGIEEEVGHELPAIARISVIEA